MGEGAKLWQVQHRCVLVLLMNNLNSWGCVTHHTNVMTSDLLKHSTEFYKLFTQQTYGGGTAKISPV